MNYIFLSLIIFSSVAACKIKDKQQDCENVMCTEIYVMITVELKVPPGTDLSAFSSKTLFASNNNILHQQNQPDTNYMNLLTVVDDSHLSTLGFNKETEVIFQLFKDGILYESYPFSIVTDCCHVEKKSGISVIEIE